MKNVREPKLSYSIDHERPRKSSKFLETWTHFNFASTTRSSLVLCESCFGSCMCSSAQCKIYKSAQCFSRVKHFFPSFLSVCWKTSPVRGCRFRNTCAAFSGCRDLMSWTIVESSCGQEIPEESLTQLLSFVFKHIIRYFLISVSLLLLVGGC